MKKCPLFAALLTALLATSFANTVPSSFWPQSDRKEQNFGNQQSSKRVLIAARSSAFKDEVVNAVIDSLVADSFFVKLTGIKSLSQNRPDEWQAVVLVNTCMAWQGDNAVQNFIRKNAAYKSFIMLTTSGDPDSCGSSKWIPPTVDAISSASEVSKRQTTVNAILAAIRRHKN
jgi:hypothetical protein